MSQSETAMTNHLWEFIRGDMAVKDFESWVYSSPELECFLGKDLFHSLISVDFSSLEVVNQLICQLRSFASSLPGSECICIQLPDLTVIDMEPDVIKAMETFKRFNVRGEPYWWLYAVDCSACGQAWLVAQDESHNDVFCLNRLTNAARTEIVTAGQWPAIFDRYDDVKLFGLKTGGRLHSGDSDYSPLVWIITRLAKNHPGIRVSEIADILVLEMSFAQSLCELAQRSFDVEIRP
jgi:hypothetical protein